MSFTKSNIAKNIAKKTEISNYLAKQLFDNFIQIVVEASYKNQVKISSFGTFLRKKTPSRIGRNPITGEKFKIPERNKLSLVLSNKIKEKIN